MVRLFKRLGLQCPLHTQGGMRSDAGHQQRAGEFTKQACVRCLIGSSQKPIIIIPILQKRKLRHREAQRLTPGSTERMGLPQVLSNGGCGFQRVLCVAQVQGHGLNISSHLCPANPIVQPQLDEFSSGSSTYGGHLEMCSQICELYRFSHLG